MENVPIDKDIIDPFMKPKIHVITKYFLPVIAGIEVNILETYSVLVKNGWDVTIHTSKDVYLQKNSLPDSEEIRGLKIKRYLFRWFGFFPEISWKEGELIALHNFDIFPHLHLLLWALFLKIVGRKKFSLVLTPHGGFNPEWSIFSPLQTFVKKTYTYTLGAWLINVCVDAIRAVSEWEKAEMIIKGINSQKVFTIANGLENEALSKDETQVGPKLKNQVKSYGRYLFGDARIYSIKNLETIVKALPLIPADIKFVNIGMVGNQNYLQTLKDIAANLGVADRVIFPGVIRGQEKYYLYRHALMFVHMAKWESFCNVVHQAISQGLICLVANNTALPFLVKDKINGFLIDTYDHKMLSHKINYVLDQKNSREIAKIKKHNLTTGRGNSWANVAQKMADLYQRL